MKLFLLMVLSSLSLCAFGQYKPVYFIGQNVTSDSTKATSYGVYGKLDGENLYALKVYDLKNNLITTGTYKDDQLKIAHGAFVYYGDIAMFNSLASTTFTIKDKTRFIAAKGSFVDGNKNGRWISFFPNGDIMEITTFVNGIRQGLYALYTKKGKIVASGIYVNDKKNGEWQFDNGKVKETYIMDVKQLAQEKQAKKN